MDGNIGGDRGTKTEANGNKGNRQRRKKKMGQGQKESRGRGIEMGREDVRYIGQKVRENFRGGGDDGNKKRQEKVK